MQHLLPAVPLAAERRKDVVPLGRDAVKLLLVAVGDVKSPAKQLVDARYSSGMI